MRAKLVLAIIAHTIALLHILHGAKIIDHMHVLLLHVYCLLECTILVDSCMLGIWEPQCGS